MKAVTLMLLTTASLLAQTSWRSSPKGLSVNKGERETLTLRGLYLSSGAARPKITLICQDGKLLSSSFNSSLTRIAANASWPSGTGKVTVSVRSRGEKWVNKKWKTASEFRSLQTDSRFVKDLITADRVDIAFYTSAASKMTAEFQPSLADAPQIMKACGIH